MGKLDEKSFGAAIASCHRCGAAAFEVSSYLDRQLRVTLGTRNDDGRWIADGELAAEPAPGATPYRLATLVDGIHRIRCLACGDEPFRSADCPRCHREGGLAEVLGVRSRLAVPKRCPGCKGTEMIVTGLAPAIVRTGAGRWPLPTATALHGDGGFHAMLVTCDGCDWVAAAEGCPLCGGPGPLRARP